MRRKEVETGASRYMLKREVKKWKLVVCAGVCPSCPTYLHVAWWEKTFKERVEEKDNSTWVKPIMREKVAELWSDFWKLWDVEGRASRTEGSSRGEDAERTSEAILEKCWAVYLRVIEAEVRRWGNWPPSPRSTTAAAAKWVTSRQTAFMSHNHTHIHMCFPVTWCLWWMRWGYNALQQRGRKCVRSLLWPLSQIIT